MTTSSHATKQRTRTRYLKSIKHPSVTMLKPGGNNKKLGSKVTTGAWKNAAIYSLTLEERTTCPPTCQQWDTCYGNNMPFAARYDHTHPEFLELLTDNISDLIRKHIFKGQGLAIRLHVLGDFYSTEYVKFWESWARDWDQLKLWGYTHRDPDTAIGEAIRDMNELHNVHIRFSDNDQVRKKYQANVIASSDTPHTGIICPEQTGAKPSCGTCAMCWTGNKEINFLRH